MRISYSQCGEDLIVKFIFDRLNITKPTYIDIGAHHPYYLSNTAIFYEEGSIGVNIEPDVNSFKQFLDFRKKDINLNMGIGKGFEELDFYKLSVSTLNTFSYEDALNSERNGYKIEEVCKVGVAPLGHVIANYCDGLFPDFLNVDAEGIDEIIINQIDFNLNYPKVICIETISFSINGNGIKNTELIEYIISKGYILYADTNINSIFIRADLWKK
jgi:hypothetical protein